jgi:hypothetical protein
MQKIYTRTNKETITVHSPESMEEISVEQFQRVVEIWDFQNWEQNFKVETFSAVTGIEADYINQSTDGRLEGALYDCVSFLLDKREWTKLDSLPIPEEITLRPIWAKDADLIPPSVVIPRKIGRLSIEQAIQARKHLEGVNDLRQGLSMVTAIYLQPLLDAKPSNLPLTFWQQVKMFFGAKDPRLMIPAPFDMLEVVKYEYLISKMYLHRVYPIGFFLLMRLNESGKKPLNVWSEILTFIRKAKGS